MLDQFNYSLKLNYMNSGSTLTQSFLLIFEAEKINQQNKEELNENLK